MKKFFQWVFPFLAALVPCALLVNLHHFFDGDGVFHHWFIAYVADYLHFHWEFPQVLNSTVQIGNVGPMFYGVLFYPLAALPAQIPGAAGAIRLLAYLLFLVQIQSVRGLVRRVGVNPLWGWAIALNCAWAIYPLTNLYSRSAIAEFFGTGFVFVGIVWFLISGFETSGKTKNRYVIGALVLGTIGVGTHPITAFMTLGVLPIAVLVYAAKCPQKWSFSLAKCSGAALFCVGLLAPWLVAMKSLGKRLDILNAYASLRTFEFDQLWVRLSPLPVDPRTFSAPVESISTPYCDTQISLGIAITFLLFYFLNFRKITMTDRILGALIFLFALAVLEISISPSSYPAIDHQLRIVQFGYRLVTPVNWLLFLGTIVSIAPASIRKSQGASPWIAIGLIGLASVGVVMKLSHATAVMSTADSSLIGPSYRSAEQHRILPGPFVFNGRDYCIHFLSPAEEETQGIARRIFFFNTGHDSKFGQVLPTQVTVTVPTRIQTNVLEHPWNSILVDGMAVQSPRLFEGRDFMMDVLIEPGTHTLSYEYRPSPRLKTAIIARDVCVVGLLILLLI